MLAQNKANPGRNANPVCTEVAFGLVLSSLPRSADFCVRFDMPYTPRPPRVSPVALLPLFWQLQFAGWGAFAVLSLPLKQIAFGSLAAAGLASACQLPISLALSTLLRRFYLWVQPTRQRFIRAALVVSAASIVACVIDVAISMPITRWLGVSARSEFVGPALYFFRAAVYLIWSLGYFLIKALLRNREQAFSAAVHEEQHRLELMRYQLNPNFLAKTLATISQQIAINPATARAMTSRLGDFYRNTLRHTDRGQTAVIGDELALLRAYLDIEQLRLGAALEVRFDVDERLLSHPLPPVLLLPLAERAILHGGGTPAKPLEVIITIQRDSDDRVLLEVGHSGRIHVSRPPFADLDEPEFAEIRASLDHHYAGNYRFRLSQDSFQVRATLSLPLAG